MDTFGQQEVKNTSPAIFDQCLQLSAPSRKGTHCHLLTLFRAGSHPRSRPFDLHSFFDAQLQKVNNMGEPKEYTEKERMSAEIVRSGPGSPSLPVLPTVNPEVEKREQPASKLHPSFYVM